MRIDMAKVVTEKPRRGHGNPSKKWGRRLGKNEHDAEDHGPTRAPIARRHQYGWNAKEFSDLLGPLRRYLRKQVGRPWNKVWSEIVRNLDSRSLSGQHIFDHIRWEVAQHVSLSPDGSLHHIRWSGLVPVSGLYVHPITGLLCYRRESWRGYRGGRFLKTQTALRAFGIERSGDSTLPRRHHASVGAAGLRLVHSQLSLRARTTRSSHHPQRWSRRAGLRVTALRTRRNKAGEQERDPRRAATSGL